MRNFCSTLAVLMLAATLAACGGTDNAAFTGTGGSGGTGGTGTGTGTGGTTPTASALVVTTSTPTIPVDGSATATITALAKNDDNNLIAGVQVCFQATAGGLAVTGGANGCVTTNSSGAAIAILSTAGAPLGAITVTATAGSQTGTATVQVVAVSQSGSTQVQMGNGTGPPNGTTGFANGVIGVALAPPAILPAGGATGLTLSIVDQNYNLYTAAPVTVAFHSLCTANSLATITATQANGGTVGVATTTTGIVNATYVASGCSGTDTITASATVGSQNLSATGSVNVAAAAIGSIQFVSASQTTIGLKGTGLNQTSTLIFKVVNSTGGPYPGVVVTFTPNTTAGGLSISPATATSGSDGTVQTTVSAGTVHEAVRVTASITVPAALSTQSSQLTVTTGLPTSNGFSIAIGAATYASGHSALACPNVDTYGIDGVTVPITVFLSDRYSNPVPDGTAVAFTTDGGQIVGNCNTSGGSCAVTWTSADPRPGPSSLTSPATPTGSDPAIVPGRTTILATAIGEESFDDVSGSGFFATGDSYSNLGEPYRDDNENNAYDSGEYFLDFNNNGVRDGPSGSFVGITCTGTSPTSTCTQNTLAIGATLRFTMSTSVAKISLVSLSGGLSNSGSNSAPSLVLAVGGGGGTVIVNVQDSNGNSMAAGTSVSLSGGSSAIMTTSQVGPNAVPCDAGTGGQSYSVDLVPVAVGNTTLTVQVASPTGTVTYLTIPVSVH